MVHVVGVSSLEKAVSLRSVQCQVRICYEACISAVPGLTLNSHCKIPLIKPFEKMIPGITLVSLDFMARSVYQHAL